MSFEKEWSQVTPNPEPDWLNSDDPVPPFNDVNSEQALDLIEKGVQVIDVRFGWEYKNYHIPEAKLIPLPELEIRYLEIDPNQPILFVCEHGMRSVDACCWLNLQGIEKDKLFNLDSGMAGYQGKTSNI